MFPFFRRKREPPEHWVLDGLVSLRDAYSGILVTGGTGSGKTSGPMKEAILNLLTMGDEDEETGSLGAHRQGV